MRTSDSRPGQPFARALAGAAVLVAAAAVVAPGVAGGAAQKSPPAPAPAQAAAAGPAVQPDAVKALHDMGGYLRSMKAFELTADVTNEVVLEDGQKLQFDGTNHYRVKPPNNLAMEINTDRKQRQIFYDGKKLSVYAPRMKYYAQVDAPPTIRQTIDALEQKYNIQTPLADLFFWGTPEDESSKLKSAQYIGYARVDGVDTDQYAYRQDGVDWQLWIERGERHLPVKIAITSTAQRELPTYTARLTWNTHPVLTPDMFAFSPPVDGMRIKLASNTLEEGAR
jgi:hypothetical protein